MSGPSAYRRPTAGPVGGSGSQRTIHMEQVSYCLFDTPLGLCGIAWRGCGDSQAPPAVTRFQFPEATTAKAEARIARKSGAPRRCAPPRRMVEIIEKVCKHLRGEVQDFRDVDVDLEGASPFARRVYEACATDPGGRDPDLRGACQGVGAARRGPGRRTGVGEQPDRTHHPVPSGRGRRRQGRRILRPRRMGDKDKAAGDRRGDALKPPQGVAARATKTRPHGRRRAKPMREVRCAA